MSNNFDTFVDPSPSDDSGNKDGLRRGYILGGNLEMVKPLGRGGMGEVWLANELDKSQKFVRQVVVKIVPRDVQNASEEMERVQESFHTVQAMQHAHVCPLYRLDKDDEFGYFIVMKYVAGPNLSTYVRDYKKTAGTLPTVKGLLPILKEIAEALDYAHGKEVIHRDIKPQNILISPEDGAQLIDFGLAATIRTSVMNVSNVEGPVSGTMFYMAPEQLRGRHQDARTDQYSFAATVYELLSGHPPFEADDRNILRTCILEESVEPLSNVPEHVNRALSRALSKDKSLRFASCLEFVQALEGVGGSSREMFSPERGPVQPPVRPSTPSTGDSEAAKGFGEKVSETIATGCGCIILALLGVLLIQGCSCIMFSSPRNSAPSSGSATSGRYSPAPTVPTGPTPEMIEEERKGYLEMIEPGKKYVTDWTYRDQVTRFGWIFESYDADSGKVTGVLFDPLEPNKKRNFIGMFDQSLNSRPPLSVKTEKATLSRNEATSATHRVILTDENTWSAGLLKDGNTLVEAARGRIVDNAWRLVPLSDAEYETMTERFAAVEKERIDTIKKLVQADQCYVANWTLKSHAGRLGLLVEKYDDARGTFSGIIFDANEIDRKKKFNGTINLSPTASPYVIQIQGDSGMKRSNGKSWTNDLFLYQDGYNRDWNVKIVDGKPLFDGRVNGYGIDGTVKLVFEDADYPAMLEKFETEEKARIEQIKTIVQKGKKYIAPWSLKGYSGRIGLVMTDVDEQKQTFSGYLYDANDTEIKKRFDGNISFDRFVSYPYILKTNTSDGSPQSNGKNRTLDLFFVKGRSYEWNLRIVDGRPVYDGDQTGYGIYGNVKLEFSEQK